MSIAEKNKPRWLNLSKSEIQWEKAEDHEMTTVEFQSAEPATSPTNPQSWFHNHVFLGSPNSPSIFFTPRTLPSGEERHQFSTAIVQRPLHDSQEDDRHNG
jgi:hypothetical protein